MLSKDCASGRRGFYTMIYRRFAIMDNEKLRLLIELADSVQEADGYIEQYMGFKDIPQKLAFLKGLIHCTILSRDTPIKDPDKVMEDDYYAMLHHIINRKLRVSTNVSCS
jgi:hypothetical protein